MRSHFGDAHVDQRGGDQDGKDHVSGRGRQTHAQQNAGEHGKQQGKQQVTAGDLLDQAADLQAKAGKRHGTHDNACQDAGRSHGGNAFHRALKSF